MSTDQELFDLLVDELATIKLGAEVLVAENTGLRAEAESDEKTIEYYCDELSELATERDGLQRDLDRSTARNVRLRRFIESNMYDAPGEAARRAREIVAETPAQSVAHIEAAALRMVSAALPASCVQYRESPEYCVGVLDCQDWIASRSRWLERDA